MTKTIEDIRNELQDKLNTLVRKRDSSILEIQKTQKDIEDIIEKQYSMDASKIRIKCINCRGTGISPNVGQDGKKHFCEVCGGPDRPYLWAEKYVEEVKKNEDDA